MCFFKRIPAFFFSLLWMYPLACLAQEQLTATSSPYLDQTYPKQQFVVAEPEPPEQVSPSDSTAANAQSIAPAPVVPTQSQEAPANSATDRDPFPPIAGVRTPNIDNANNEALGKPEYTPPPPPPPTPTVVNPQPQGEPPKIGLQFYPPTPNPAVQQQPTPSPSTPTNPTGAPSDEFLFAPSKPVTLFQGGLDARSFIQCQKIATGACSRTVNNVKFTNCLTQIASQPVCRQFVAFAGLSRFGINDDMDIFQPYNQANLTLIHLTRGGTLYPGDYFVIGNNGGFVDINAGKEAQTIDISKDPNYPSIVMQFKQVQMWSLIDKAPRIEPPMTGNGIRMVFSYQLRDGCATCDLIGYADVAFDFSQDGALEKTSLLGLRTLR